MKTLVGTTGALAVALFLASAPHAAAQGIPLRPAQPIELEIGTESAAPQGGINLGSGQAGSSGDTGSGETGSGIGTGSAQTGSTLPIPF
ncbi:hypothetical protein [Nocardia crassostreae]|uniref:hypothetical protein n=1 Tax=Nocardia crassostreae TaxID=53428 RepID=UPI000A73DFBE|nr:hypothetical protein [Nocardia crassostreae]